MGGGASDCDRCPLLQSDKPYGRSHILHQNRLLLIASEVGIPLCIGIHHAWDRDNSPTPWKPTSMGGEMKRMPQENNGSADTQ